MLEDLRGFALPMPCTVQERGFIFGEIRWTKSGSPKNTCYQRLFSSRKQHHPAKQRCLKNTRPALMHLGSPAYTSRQHPQPFRRNMQQPLETKPASMTVPVGLASANAMPCHANVTCTSGGFPEKYIDQLNPVRIRFEVLQAG